MCRVGNCFFILTSVTSLAVVWVCTVKLRGKLMVL